MSKEELYNMLRYSKRYHGMVQNIEEVVQLCCYLENEDIKNVLEIGIRWGGSFYIWCKFFSDDGIKIGVDKFISKFKDSNARYKRSMSINTWAKKVFLIEGDSNCPEIAEKIKDVFQDEKVDFLFIDGGHSYEEVKQDYENYSPLVRKNGFIVFHDKSNSKKGVGVSIL